MLDSLLLGAAALLHLDNPVFHEEVIVLPGGEVEVSTDFEWNALTFGTADGSPVPKIWYERRGEMIPWYQAESQTGTPESDQLDLLFAGNPKQKLVIASDEPVELVGHFFNTQIADEHAEAKFDPIEEDTKRFANKSKIPSFISRSQWGADESIRYWKLARGIRNFFRQIAPEAKRLPREQQPIIKAREHNGKKLTWPIEENQVIKKFIVHHTGEVIDEKREPRELMRAIYYYHTITRGWGDIGYNYVIDQLGNIYEGRAGGIATVGAHTAYYNTGTVGMALMGNFQIEEPTDAQLKVLALLLADHSVRFNVNPVAKSNWLGTYAENVAGHREVAQPGHGTACPGENLLAKLPAIRLEAARLARDLRKHKGQTTRDFLKKSSAAPDVRGRIDRNPTNFDAVSLAQVIKTKNLQRGERASIELKIRNNTKLTWLKGEKITAKNVPDGIFITDLEASQVIKPGQIGTFKGRMMVRNTPNGVYSIGLTPRITTLAENDQVNPINYPVRVSGDRSNLTKSVKDLTNSLKASSFKSPEKTVTQGTNFGPDIKVKLSYFDENFANVSGNEKVEIWSQNRKISTVNAGERIQIKPGKDRGFRVVHNDSNLILSNPKLITNGVLTIENYSRGFNTGDYNEFRKQLNFFTNGNSQFYIVNQLPLEQYLWGLSEQPVTEPTQKKHAIHILARSYAYVYAGNRRKFKTLNYDLEDSPATSQFYLGHGWERYHQKQKDLLKETWGVVLTHNGKPVIGPYFTQSDGQSESKWISQYPWTVGRLLPYDKGLEAKGHEVGLSGNSARVLAEKGKNYREILDYFFTDVSTKKVY